MCFFPQAAQKPVLSDGLSILLRIAFHSSAKRKDTVEKSTLSRAFSGGGRWIRTTEGIASRFTVCPLWPLGNSPIFISARGGAGGRTRTPDLLITNQLLYRLSYTSILPVRLAVVCLAPERLIIIANDSLFVNYYFRKKQNFSS